MHGETEAMTPSSEVPQPAAHFEVHPTHVDAESPLPRPVSSALSEAPPPSPTQVESAAPPVEPAASPRRRSTVREPAPVFGEPTAAPSPPAEPIPEPALVVAEPAPEPAPADDNKPRRSGWWSRRA
jgi:ribonuclease E